MQMYQFCALIKHIVIRVKTLVGYVYPRIAFHSLLEQQHSTINFIPTAASWCNLMHTAGIFNS